MRFGRALWASPPADDARLFYSKSFPGSTPAYRDVTLEENGDADYREAADDDLPLKFHLTDAETQTVFALAEKLDHFKHPLESPLKVAFMGAKTFRYENGDAKSRGEVQLLRGSVGAGAGGLVRAHGGIGAAPRSSWSAPPSTTSWG